MDFMNRGSRPAQTETKDETQSVALPKASGRSDKSNNLLLSGGVKFASIVLLFSSTALVVALLASLFLGGNRLTPERKFVNTDEYQAVFLNGGQVYFGKIGSLNSDYVRLADIYYLRVNQQVQPGQENQAQNNVSLVKLGCELHGPQDVMVINREQVIFWENLKADGQVSKAVEEFKKQNPNGQNCAQQADTSNDSAPSSDSKKSNE